MKTKRSLCLLLSLVLLAVCISAGTAEFYEEAAEEDPSALLEMAGALGGGSEEAEEEEFAGTFEMAATGRQIWSVSDGELLCTDMTTWEELDAVELEDLPEMAGIRPAGEEVTISCCGLGAFRENALLFLNWQDGGENHSMLFHLGLKDNEIQLLRTQDATEQLRLLFDGKTAWNEVNMTASGDAVYFGVLDSDFMFRQVLYHPDSGEVLTLEEQSLMIQYAVFPWQDHFLVLRVSLEEEQACELMKLDAVTGDISRVDTVKTGSFAQPMNLASDPAGENVCFTINNSAYRYRLGSGQAAEPFAVLPENPVDYRTGLAAGECYVVQTEERELMPVNIRATLSSTRLNIANIAADDSIADLAGLYNLQHPESYAAITDGGEESAVLDEMLSGSSRFDLYVVRMNTEAYSALLSRGYMGDMSGSSMLTALAEDFTPAVRQEIIRDGRLYAMPLYTDNRCLLLNTEWMAQTAGVPEESIPTSWPEFLALTARISQSGLLREDGGYCFGEPGMTAESFREQLLAWILNDCLLWLRQDESRLSQLPQVLTPILQAMETINFEGLGLAKEDAEDLTWFMTNPQKGVLTEEYLEIEASTREPGTVFWPLSVTAGGERLIPQEIAAVFVNPYSEHPDLALSYVEYVWENMDVLRKMIFCRSLNEPVVNSAYEEDLAYLEAMIPEYEAALEGAPGPEEKAVLTQELQNLQDELADYRENGRWYASEESIAAYREKEEQLRPAAPDFWSADEEDQAVLQYLDGMISADLFARQLQAALRMHQMELE